MITHTITESLEKIEFFKGMPEEQLDFIAGCASNVRFEEGEFMLLEGHQAESFFVVREGRSALELSGANRTFTIQTFDEGDIVGWSWLIPPHEWTYDVRALTPVAAIAFDAVCIRKKASDDPALGYELYRRFSEVVADRLLATRMQLMDVYN